MKKYLYILCWCFVQCTLTCFAQSNLMAASDTIKLSEVTVSAERPLVQRKADRMIVSVEHSKMLKARSLSNILQLIPDVDYDGEGGISVMGNSVKIYERGRLLNLRGAQLKSYLSSLRGKVVMLQFTASWCGVCRKEMPFIEKDIWQKHQANDRFVLIGIDRDEPLDKVIAFGKAVGVTYPLGLDPGADIFAKYALRESGITRNVLIDRDGRIVKLTRLYNEEEFASLVARIDAMLTK